MLSEFSSVISQRSRGGDVCTPVARLGVNSHPCEPFVCFFSDSVISRVLCSASLLSFSSLSLPDTSHPPQSEKETPSPQVLPGEPFHSCSRDCVNHLGPDSLRTRIIPFLYPQVSLLEFMLCKSLPFCKPGDGFMLPTYLTDVLAGCRT